MKINLETLQPEIIKILKVENDKISAIGYGPFDNGYLIIGLKSGHIVIFDILHLDKV
jgi:hypothetical protein